MLPPKHPQESRRLDLLRSLHILDTPAEKAFDDLTFLASVLCHTPMALVTLIDENRQWFKSKVGLPPEVQETPLELSFCAHAMIKPEELLIVPDSLEDFRFRDNPAATSGLKVRFYAGAPLLLGNGMPIGTLCVADQKPRDFNPQERLALQALARQVVAQIELRMAVRTKATFLANMSHEIRTPMNAILGVSAMLQDTTLSDAQQQYLSTIRASGEGLLTIINDILEFSKNESGHLVFEEQDFDLHPLVDEAARIVRESRSTKKDVALHVSWSGDVPARVRGDAGRLRQVLLNLLGNAMKFTERGQVELRVRTESGQNHVRFDVEDTGIGIAPDALESLFKPFVQADASTHRRFGGTGLGLAISRQIVQALGGDIQVKSQLGKGSVFSFDAQFKPAQSAADTTAPAAAVTPIPPTLRILLAEDNRSNREIAQFFLKKIGCRADTAENGRVILEALAKNTYDVILMDCLMPEMDGYEATQAIRQNEKKTGAHIRIIAMTANALSEDRERCLAAGMDDYVSKPISLNSLRDALARQVSA